ncbi:MAG TPA: hypothetical protein VNS58_00725 [Puia sp.]|nr:hypothetical protein [Puia sp.]
MAKDLKKISLTLSFEEKPTEEISLIGFLFYCNGIYLQQALVRDSRLEFNLADMTTAGAANAATTGTPRSLDIRQLQVFIAPATDKNIQNVRSVEELEQYKPYSPILQTNADGTISILPIPSLISKFWPFCTCRVTGKVSKWFSVDNTWENRPVCRARVTIYDIDAIWYWIYRIPDYIIAKVPEAILNPQEVIKFPIPIPDPPPFTINAATTRAVETKSLFRTVSVEERQMEYAASLPELSVEIRQTLASGNLNRIRETIAANYTLFHPWFCLWPIWWPWFYYRRELAVVYTDASGRFDTQVSYWCTGDKPDIYLTVDYLINGVWTSVYEPPIPCYTFWDYVCGTNININITDPRVPGDCCCNCGIPGEVVWIRSVGSTSVSHINQLSYFQTPPDQSVPYNRIGLTDASAIYDPSFLPIKNGDYQRPFGGYPTFVVGFGTDLPNAGIYYYRWSYKKVADASLAPVSDSYKPLLPAGGITQKGYEFTYIDSHGDTQFGPNSVKLGPFTVGSNDNLYIIPPESPAMAPFSAPETDPQWNEPSYANLSISFNSSDLRDASNARGDGLYEFKLELFNQAGALLTNLPKVTFKVPDASDPGFSVNAPDVLLAGVTPTTANGYNMLMRIDNSSCQADIYTVKVNGTSASSDCCGFVAYAPGGVEAVLDLSFQAEQPNNFAVFSFSVERGTCGYVAIADATGMVIDSADGYIRNSSSIYDKAFTPAQLLESCYGGGSGKAAFAEVLSVAATATDGTYRQIARDAGKVAAFALEP